MQKISSVTELDDAINDLNRRKKLSRFQIEHEIKELEKSLSPKNIFKNVMDTFGSKDGVQNNAANTAAALGSGWLAKKIFSGNSTNFIKNIGGKILQFVITGIVTKNSGGVINKAFRLLESKNK